MENNNNVKEKTNAEKHERTKKKLKIIGITLLAAGAAFVITGFVDFIKNISTFNQPQLFWCLIVGFPMLGFGGMVTAMGFRKEIARYVKNESVPIINEVGEEITPAVTSIAGAAVNAVKGEEKIKCPECGTENANDSNFCQECGAKLKKVCPSCGEVLDNESKFCDKCGYKL